MINRSPMREIPHSPVALYEVANLFGTLIAETILASVHVRACKQAGHMGASDLIKTLQIHLARRVPSTYGSWTAPVLVASSPNSGTRCRGAVHPNMKNRRCALIPRFVVYLIRTETGVPRLVIRFRTAHPIFASVF